MEQELSLRKIGTPDQEDQLYIRIFNLMPGDVIITGSDGRDDLVLRNQDGVEFIQEDEQQFLMRVEEGDGHQEQYYESYNHQTNSQTISTCH